MKEYEPFAISNFRTGLDKAMQPWLIPRDAYQTMENAHLYLGVLEKITGYTLFAKMSYRQSFTLTGDIDGVNDTFTGITSSLPSTNNITIQATTNAGATVHETFVDSTGTGVLTSDGGGTGTLDYTTGAISVTFGTPPADLTVGGVQYNSVVMTFDALNLGRDIMGIKQYIGDTGTQEVLIFDTRRVGKIVPFPSGSLLIPTQGVDNGISEIPHEVQYAAITTGFNGTVGPFTGTVASTFLIPGEVTFRVFDNAGVLLDTITDNASGLLTGTTLDPAGSNYINYATGQWVMTFNTNQASSNTVNFFGCVYGDTFTGDYTNFFSTTNYNAKTFITNNKDFIRYYDGVCLKYLNTNLTAKPTGIFNTYDITQALHVVAYRERLVLLSYTQNGIPAFNAAAWSVAGDPLDFTNGEFAIAPTSDNIRSIGLINFDLVVDMQGTTWVLRYTNDAFAPFRWDRINNTWRHDAAYSGINYDTYMTSVGKPAITSSNAVNVYRIDEIIPDFTFTNMDQNSLSVCYGERFDDFKEGWLCFPSVENSSNAIIRSDRVLAYNYLDETYAVYDFPFSCLGFGRVSRNLTWGDIQQKWQDYDVTWGSSFLQDNRIIDLAGDHNGNVFELGTGNTLGDGTTPVTMNVITKNFNPYVEEGELARFGYLDLYVNVVNETKLRVQFYINDEMDDNYTTYYLEQTITFTPNNNGNETKEWKRIYVGAVGQIHTIRLYQDPSDFTSETLDQPVKINSMVLWMKRAGRIYS